MADIWRIAQNAIKSINEELNPQRKERMNVNYPLSLDMGQGALRSIEVGLFAIEADPGICFFSGFLPRHLVLCFVLDE